MNNKTDFWNAVAEADTIAIGGHVRPDGDCVGSCMGLYQYIKENFSEKTVTVFLGEFSDTFRFLEGMDRIVYCDTPDKVEKAVQEAMVYDLFIALDSSNTERLEFFEVFRKATNTICVDHHKTNEGYAKYNYVFQASSTAEAVFDMISFYEKADYAKVSQAVAQSLYLGIVHDTGVFKYSSAKRHTMEVAGALIDTGIDTAKIIDDTFYHKTYVQNLILGRTLIESVRHENGKIISGVVPRQYFDFYGASKPDLEGIVEQLRLTEGVEVAVFAFQTLEGNFKFSLRSKSYVDVSQIAVKFGGGGHVKAAGCTMGNDYDDGLSQIIEEIKKQLK